MNKNFAVLAMLVFQGPLWSGQDLPPKPEPIDPEKARVIRQIVAITDASEKKMKEGMMASYTTALRTSSIYPPDYITELMHKYQERVDHLDLAGMQIPIYAKRFSLEELNQILGFPSLPDWQTIYGCPARDL